MEIYKNLSDITYLHLSLAYAFPVFLQTRSPTVSLPVTLCHANLLFAYTLTFQNTLLQNAK